MADNETTKTGKVKLASVNVSDPNHVGQKKEWFCLAEVNGVRIEISKEKTISILNNKVVFKLEAYEKDKIQDKGSISKEFSYDKIKGEKVSLNVIVEENRGRYAGNKATVTFSFDIG